MKTLEEVKCTPSPISGTHGQPTDQIGDEFPLDSTPIILDFKMNSLPSWTVLVEREKISPSVPTPQILEATHL